MIWPGLLFLLIGAIQGNRGHKFFNIALGITFAVVFVLNQMTMKNMYGQTVFDLDWGKYGADIVVMYAIWIVRDLAMYGIGYGIMYGIVGRKKKAAASKKS